MHRSRAAAIAVGAALVTVAGVAPAVATVSTHPAVRRVATHAKGHRPAAPRLPVSYEGSARGGRAVELVQWHKSRTKHLRRYVVRYARGRVAPAGVHRGHGVHLTSKRATKVRLTRLATNSPYAVSIFAVDRAGRVSRPAVTRFTTPGTHRIGPRGTLRGTVSDAAGHPLRGATVDTFDSDYRYGPTVTTDSAGHFVLGLAPGRWTVSAAGERATGGNSDATGYSYDESSPVVVRSGRSTSTPTLRLPAGAAVSGRIVDNHGRPVAGAYPYVAPILPFAQLASFGGVFSLSFEGSGALVTGADGRYTLRGLPAGEAFALCASGTDSHVAGRRVDLRASCRTRSTAPAAGAATTLSDLALTPGPSGVVTGRLRAQSGRGVSGVVTFNSRDRTLYAFSEPDGTFRLTGVTAGHYTVCGSTAPYDASSRTGYVPACRKHTVSVRTGATTRTNVTLRRGGAVSGTVLGPHGRRLAGVNAYVESTIEDGPAGYATSDENGQWRVVGLPTGTYRACLDGSSVQRPATGAGAACWHKRATFSVKAGRIRSGIDARLRAAAGVSGVVRDRQGKPVADAFVTAVPVTSSDFEDDDEGSARTDARGRYVIGGLSGARVSVCAVSDFGDIFGAASDSTATCTARVRPRAGRIIALRDVVLPAATAVTVTVHDTSGTPVAGVDVVTVVPCAHRIEDEEEDCQRTSLLPRTGVETDGSAVTDAAGTVTLYPYDKGKHAVCALAYFGTTVSGGSPTGYADGCHGTGFDVAVTPHTTRSVTITLGAGGTVSGRLRDTKGKPVGHARMVVPGSAADDGPQYPFGWWSSDDEDEDEDALPSLAAANLTGADGRFTVIGVRPGRWTVCATDPDYDTPRFAPNCAGGVKGKGVTVTAGANTTADVVVARSR